MNIDRLPGQHAVETGTEKPQFEPIPDADVISLETVVNMLVQKKICTIHELFMMEGQLQEQNRELHKTNFVTIQNQYDQGKWSGLKHWMSKRRWSRKLGTALFGWKWKKVKKAKPV